MDGSGTKPSTYRRTNWTLNRTAGVVFCLLAAFLCVNAVLSLNATRRLTEIRQRIALAHETIEELQNLAGLVKNADLEARGYLLTGEPTFLEPYQEAVDGIEIRLDVLKGLLAKDPGQPEVLPDLAQLIRTRLHEISQVLAIHETTGRQAAVAHLSEGDGRFSMGQIRRAISEMTLVERGLLTQRENEADQATNTAILTFAAVNLSALVTLIMAYVLAVAYLRRRQRSREQLEKAYGELEVRVQERTAELAAANRTLQGEIEERRRAQVELKREHELLQAILNSLGEGVVVADAQGRMVLFNPAGERILGFGATTEEPDRWARAYGMYEADRSTLIEPSRLPLVRAFRGESFDDVEFHVRNARIPAGADVSATGRPMMDEDGELLGGVIVFRDVTQKKKMAAEREDLLQKMMEALSQVKTLSGLLPICAGCKSIRDDKGYWRRLEAYISEHSQAEFSHGLCPKCASELYPEAFPAKK